MNFLKWWTLQINCSFIMNVNHPFLFYLLSLILQLHLCEMSDPWVLILCFLHHRFLLVVIWAFKVSKIKVLNAKHFISLYFCLFIFNKPGILKHRLAAEQCLDWSNCDSSSPSYLYVSTKIQGQLIWHTQRLDKN